MSSSLATFATETVAGGAAFPAGTTLYLPSDGGALPALSALELAAANGSLNTTTDAILAAAVSGKTNELLVESGNAVHVPVGYTQIADLSTTSAPTIFTNGNTATTVLGGLSGMTVWDGTLGETVYTGGGDNVIGLSATVSELLYADLSGASDVVAMGYGSGSVTGGGASNIIWGSGTNGVSNLNVHLVRGSSTVMAGIGSNTIDLGGTNDVIFGGGGTNNDTITGANDIFVGGAGPSTVTAGASDVIFAGSSTMTASIAGAGAIFVGNTGNDTINAGTGVTGWGGLGTMEFIVNNSQATIVGGQGSTMVYQAGSTSVGTYFNNGSGVMTVNGGINSTGGTIIERWAGSGGMLVDASTSTGDTIVMTEGNDTVWAGTALNGTMYYNGSFPMQPNNDTVNFYGNASGSILSGQSNIIGLESSGNVTVNDSNISASNVNGLLSGHNLIDAQNATGSVDITFSILGDTVIGGAGSNTYTPFVPSTSNTSLNGHVESVSFGTGTNNLVLNSNNTGIGTTLDVYNFNPNRDNIEFIGLTNTSLAQEAATMAEQNLVMPNGQDKASTFFITNALTVDLYAGPSASSLTPMSSIVASHFVTA